MDYIDERSQFALSRGYTLHQRYVIQEVIGMGGFGITYKCRDIYNNMDCAVKELFMYNVAVRLSDGKNVGANEDCEKILNHGIKRFMEEAEILNEISGTPNVVNITDYFRENNTAYYVMEYVDAPTLKKVVAQSGGKIPFDRAREIIGKVGETLDYIYRRYSIYHRDLSPDNIMVCNDGSPKIIDFGNAKTYIRNSGEKHSIVLKPGFAPPEQYTGTNQGPWTDVYSLAVIFYYITSGVKIPPASDRLMGETYTPLCELVEECDKGLSDEIDKALRLNPKERLQSMGEFASAIRKREKEAAHAAEEFPVLTVYRDGMSVERWRMPLNEEVIVGRNSNQNNIGVGTNQMLSKQHCIVRYDSSRKLFVIADISVNGVMLRGAYIKKEEKYEVRPGEAIWLGDKICELRLEVAK